MAKAKLRIGITLTGRLAEAMIQESEQTLAQYAAIARAALVQYLTERGYEVEDEVRWGGVRTRQTDEDDAAEK